MPASHLADAEHELAEFFDLQGAAVAGRWPTTAARTALSRVFGLDRWNRALASVIEAVALAVSAAAGRSVLAGLGLSEDTYESDATTAWLAQHAAGVAAGINGRTRDTVRNALTAGLSSDEVRSLFRTFADARAPQIARTEVTAATGFGTREAARQSGRELTKTWVAGSSPRASHARLDGETVPMEELFSNGARWPGDSRLDDKERSGCNCSMTVDAA